MTGGIVMLWSDEVLAGENLPAARLSRKKNCSSRVHGLCSISGSEEEGRVWKFTFPPKRTDTHILGDTHTHVCVSPKAAGSRRDITFKSRPDKELLREQRRVLDQVCVFVSGQTPV